MYRGLLDLSFWMRIRAGDMFYLDIPYANFGFARILSAIGLITLATWAAWDASQWPRQLSWNWVWLLLPLAGGWAVRRLDFRPLEVRYYEAQKQALRRSMSEVEITMMRCGWRRGDLPEATIDCPELGATLATGQSPYSLKGKPLPYRLVILPKADGPLRQPPQGAEPGTFYATVSKDRKAFWLTVVALPMERKPVPFYASSLVAEISATPVWLYRYDTPYDQPLVHGGRLIPGLPTDAY
jgi:hypothetical protein